jgi:hypothetical protein
MHDSITWIGMDVHKERIHVVAVNEAGHTEAHWEAPNTTKGKGTPGNAPGGAGEGPVRLRGRSLRVRSATLPLTGKGTPAMSSSPRP